MEIFKTVSDEHYSYCNATYYFVGDNGYLRFYQMGSYDLAFTAHKFNNDDSIVSFEIDKEKYPEINKLIDNMFVGIDGYKFLRGTDRIIEEYQTLFKNGYFSWQSDAPANECSNGPFIYHYFNIYKNDGIYTFEFVCANDSPFFTVEVNTDRSRYAELRFPVWDFFNKLKIAEIYEVKSYEELSKIIKGYKQRSRKE